MVEHIVTTSMSDTDTQSLVKKMLEEHADDFVPSLQARISVAQSDFTDVATEVGVSRYLQSLVDAGMDCLVYLKENTPIGLLAYKRDLDSTDPLLYGVADDVSDYIATILVSKEVRGLRIADRLYEEVEKTSSSRSIVLRTWSTNMPQRRIMSRRGYEQALVIKDDRGEGIDTIYFRKRVA